MKTGMMRLASAIAFLVGCMSIVNAQNSLPAPGTGGMFTPGISGPGSMPPPGSGMNPGWNQGGWGGPGWNGPAWGGMNPGWGGGPEMINQNSGVLTVPAAGYDAYGVWRVIPIRVQYAYNGINYNVNVLSAWNPWMNMWNRNVDVPAYSTLYVQRGQAYHYYAPLSTGTYYFNL